MLGTHHPGRHRAIAGWCWSSPWRSPRSACGTSRGCRSTPCPTSPMSRCRSTPRRRAIRRWKPSSASPSRSRPRWPGLPRLDYTRSISRYGLSQVTVVFEDGTDIYFARQQVAERLQQVELAVAAGRRARCSGPIATGLGEIFMYTVEAEPGATQAGRHAVDARPTCARLQDWVVRPQLRNVPGVTEVNTIGGFVRQIHVTPDPAQAGRATASRCTTWWTRSPRNNANVGAGYIERNGEQYLVRVPGQVGATRATCATSCSTAATACRSACATSPRSARARNCAPARPPQNGREVVLGTVFMLIGENSRAVAQRAAARLEEINASLPEGVHRHAGLRPHRTGRPHHRHGAEEPGRRRAAGDRGAVPAARQPARGADHRGGDSAGDADDHHRHGAQRRVRQPDEPGRARLRPDRRWRGDHRRELPAPLRRGAAAAGSGARAATSASSWPPRPPPK